MSLSSSYKPETMDKFFSARIDGYEDHMKESPTYEAEQAQLAEQFDVTSEPVTILDLGCGTGMEIEYILRRVPNARFVCIDLCKEMLDRLEQKYAEVMDQITIIHASYFDYDFGEEAFDYAVAAQTMHHWLSADKLQLYERVYRCLKPTGRFVVADYIVTPDEEYRLLDNYMRLKEDGLLDENKLYHIDIPFSMHTERRVLREAGFRRVETVFEYRSIASNPSLIVVYKEDAACKNE